MTDRNAFAPLATTPKTPDSHTCPGVDRPFFLIAIVWAVVFVAMYSLLPLSPHEPVQQAATTIDPNEAPWWELTVLPRIGETLARQIAARRQQTRFNSPTDLQRVRGIGPKTARRVAPFLRFPSNDVTESDPDSHGLHAAHH